MIAEHRHSPKWVYNLVILSSHDRFRLITDLLYCTQAYGSRHFYKAGSILQTKQLEVSSHTIHLPSLPYANIYICTPHLSTVTHQIISYDFTNPSSLLPLGLRFFSPLEIARLHAFPVPLSENQLVPPSQPKQSTAPRLFCQPASLPHLEFPEAVTTIQRHRLLGNSLNCWVVAELLRCVLFRNPMQGSEQ